MASPLTAGTFHRAIAESGAVFTQPTLAAAETSGSVQYWTRFARTGKPSARRSPRWPRWSLTSAPQYLSLEAPSPFVMSEGSFRGDHKCSFWDNLLGN